MAPAAITGVRRERGAPSAAVSVFAFAVFAIEWFLRFRSVGWDDGLGQVEIEWIRTLNFERIHRFAPPLEPAREISVGLPIEPPRSLTVGNRSSMPTRITSCPRTRRPPIASEELFGRW